MNQTTQSNFERLMAGFRMCCQVAMKHNHKACPVCGGNVPYFCKARELRPGDVIVTSPVGPLEAFSHAVVKELQFDGDVAMKQVRLVRPYMHTSDFIYTGGVIPYIGFEEYSVYPSADVIVVRESFVTDVRIAETDEGRIRRAGGKIERTPDGGLRRVER